MSCKKNIKYVMVNIDKLIRQGAHYGQFSNIGHPQTRKFLYGSTSVRNNQVIDLVQTGLSLQKARNLIHQVSIARGTILLVATEDPMSTILSRLGDKYPIHYVNTKWIGGMLTNWKTLSQAIRKFHTLDFLSKNGQLETLSSQDIVKLKKQKSRLEKYLGGIKYLTGLPWLVVVLGPGDKRGVISECEKLDIPTIGVLDTYCNPSDFTIYVPCSAEAPQSHSWIVIQIIEAIVSNLKRFPSASSNKPPRLSSRSPRLLSPSKYLNNPSRLQDLIDDLNRSTQAGGF